MPAILLAGGRATRLGGGDKCLRPLGGRPILARVIDILRPQVGPMLLNANGDPARFAAFGLPVVADDLADQPGPLAGILAGLDWVAAELPAARFALSASTDCPFLPADLAQRLAAALAGEDADIALAASAGRVHPVIGLWRVTLRTDLRQALTSEGLRKVELFCDRHRTHRVNFPVTPLDPFLNLNTEADFAAAESLLAQSRT
ncbi:MAG: molybdenum cofactor guanylyltransferase MobA [Rhodospirillaceae bacterium]|nr:molybdenum cofactor guanylyltransferase MobA [Rhodospirillaceae bacterium]